MLLAVGACTDVWCPAACSVSPTSCCLFRLPYFLLPVPSPLLPAACSVSPTSCCLFRLPYFLLPVPSPLLPAACSVSPTSCCLFHLPYFLLPVPSPYFLLPVPSPYFLLPVPSPLLPAACSVSPTSCCCREETRVVQTRQSKLYSWWSNLRENNPITNCEAYHSSVAHRRAEGFACMHMCVCACVCAADWTVCLRS